MNYKIFLRDTLYLISEEGDNWEKTVDIVSTGQYFLQENGMKGTKEHAHIAYGFLVVILKSWREYSVMWFFTRRGRHRFLGWHISK